MIKAVIFDFGDVIVRLGSVPIWEKHSLQRGFEKDAIKKLFNEYFSGAHQGDFESLEHFFKVAKPSLAITVEEMNAIFDEMKLNARLDLQVLELIQSLKPRYKIGLLSNFHSGLEDVLVNMFKIFHLFDVVISSYDLRMKKPDPRIYQYALKELGVLPEEAVFIDDNEKNVAGARQCGIHAIHFQNFEQMKGELDLMQVLLRKI